MAIVVIGLSHHTSPVEMRERFAFAESKIPEALQRLRSAGLAEEAVILSTCNRVEIYAALTRADRPAFQALQRFLVDWSDYRGPLNDEVYSLGEPQSVEHLFKVAAGLDSNRSPDRAQALAEELGGRAVPFERWAKEFEKIDIVISSTAAPHYILDRAKLEPLMKIRRNRPLLLIDIAVPRDIEPEINFLESVYLYNID